jgi:SAM-dependent methyltransferase
MNWYESWFDSPYYPILYQQRDEQEAAAFIERLLNRLELPRESHVLDMACGRGRHARCMAALGMRVTGIDLSEPSLLDAQAQPMPGLAYLRHDMREPLTTQGFDGVMNLFTSFGYFEDPDDDRRVIRTAFTALRPGGFFVLDYLNIHSVLPQLPARETVVNAGIRFSIHRHHVLPWILKDIGVQGPDRSLHFQEKIRCYSPADLADMLTASGFRVKAHLGDYHLNPPLESAPRALFICTKPETAA